ncbi:MAG: hypothetical protein DWQ37_13575 [Planctomycetota bacterium]|nr:MAG: hypothetical protein DWQ37_13575 [Planctomycetota bacterium]
METSLHDELKRHYAGPVARTEVVLGNYRIDAVRRGRLIEIQHGSLAAIRDKVRSLLEEHRVLVVKPIVATKILVKHAGPGEPALSSRKSPKRGRLLDAFDELVYFTRVFPHPRLTVEVVMVDVEEWRYPGHGRRRRWRRNDHVLADQKLLAVGKSVRLRRAADLVKLMPAPLPTEFHTGILSEHCDIDRHTAQRIAYCLRKMKAAEQFGKQGNTLLYRLPRRRGAA